MPRTPIEAVAVATIDPAFEPVPTAVDSPFETITAPIHTPVEAVVSTFDTPFDITVTRPLAALIETHVAPIGLIDPPCVATVGTVYALCIAPIGPISLPQIAAVRTRIGRERRALTSLAASGLLAVAAIVLPGALTVGTPLTATLGTILLGSGRIRGFSRLGTSLAGFGGCHKGEGQGERRKRASL
ncbi:MAG: hypothetical protein QNJ15_01620 [Erythrobacter sp.]|nr:hypothetical protein [Erythrobacter sp.]